MELMKKLNRLMGGGEMATGQRLRATWQGKTLAESDETEIVEGNHYFPADSVNRDLVRPNSKHTVCPWKGTASYLDVVVDGQVNPGAAWYYPEPKPAAANIKDRVAFWQGVKVEPIAAEEPARG